MGVSWVSFSSFLTHTQYMYNVFMYIHVHVFQCTLYLLKGLSLIFCLYTLTPHSLPPLPPPTPFPSLCSLSTTRPCSMYVNPIDTESAEVKPAHSLDANEVLVVYRQDRGDHIVQRRIQYGPTIFIPSADEWYNVHVHVHVYIYVNVCEFGHWVCGESWHATQIFTHCPSSQGWAPCVHCITCMWWFIRMEVSCFSFLVYCAHILLYVVHAMGCRLWVRYQPYVDSATKRLKEDVYSRI